MITLRDLESMMGSSEASRILGVSSARVSQLNKEGKLDAIVTRLGRLYRAEDVEELRLKRASRR